VELHHQTLKKRPHRGSARHGNVCLVFATSLFLSTSISSPSFAQQEGLRDTSIRAAAIKKLQSRLGDMRGSIGLRDKRVRLTQQMIDRLKPPVSDTEQNEIDQVITNSVESRIVLPEVSMDVILRQADILEQRMSSQR